MGGGGGVSISDPRAKPSRRGHTVRDINGNEDGAYEYFLRDFTKVESTRSRDGSIPSSPLTHSPYYYELVLSST